MESKLKFTEDEKKVLKESEDIESTMEAPA
jgi:hypothetical protein